MSSVQNNGVNNPQIKINLNQFQKSDSISRDSNIFASENKISMSESTSLLKNSFGDYYDKKAQEASSNKKSSIGLGGLDVSA